MTLTWRNLWFESGTCFENELGVMEYLQGWLSPREECLQVRSGQGNE